MEPPDGSRMTLINDVIKKGIINMFHTENIILGEAKLMNSLLRISLTINKEGQCIDIRGGNMPLNKILKKRKIENILFVETFYLIPGSIQEYAEGVSEVGQYRGEIKVSYHVIFPEKPDVQLLVLIDKDELVTCRQLMISHEIVEPSRIGKPAITRRNMHYETFKMYLNFTKLCVEDYVKTKAQIEEERKAGKAIFKEIITANVKFC